MWNIIFWCQLSRKAPTRVLQKSRWKCIFSSCETSSSQSQVTDWLHCWMSICRPNSCTSSWWSKSRVHSRGSTSLKPFFSACACVHQDHFSRYSPITLKRRWKCRFHLLLSSAGKSSLRFVKEYLKLTFSHRFRGCFRSRLPGCSSSSFFGFWGFFTVTPAVSGAAIFSSNLSEMCFPSIAA